MLACRSSVQEGLGVLVEVFHSQVHASKPTTRNLQIACRSRSRRQEDGIVLRHEPLWRGSAAQGPRHAAEPGSASEVGVCAEFNPFTGHELDATLDNLPLVRLHVRNAIHHQATDAISALEDCDMMAIDAIELVGSCQSSRTGADHGDSKPRAVLRNAGDHEAHLPCLVDDCDLDRLDAHRLVNDPQHTRTLAWRGTDTTCELGKVVRGKQSLESLFPLPLMRQLVPLRDQVSQWAP
mmetsp:Transcript_97252/g.243817  ORF Transcript_97252/g.243817 Transcript_97252/m.243817 type:complete len:237 (-) Transcript_97252:4977-5687(-)